MSKNTSSHHKRSGSAPHTSPINICAWEGCEEHGEFRAPKNRHILGTNSPGDYHHFCLIHIREHNRNWDYFDGMEQPDIEKFQKEAIHGHRPTWKSGMPQTTISQAAVEAAFATFMGHEPPPSAHTKPEPAALAFSSEERKAFAVLDLSPDTEWDGIKRKYKMLVKKIHPDVNNGAKAAEDQFKEVVAAYRCLEAYFTG